MDTETPFLIRDFDPADRPAVVDLLRRVLDRPGDAVHDDAYFRWKHLENPFGRSLMLVAEAEGRIVGFRAIMMWQLQMGGSPLRAGRPVDTVTDPSWRRQGVFSTLTRAALSRLKELGIDLLFNTPNDQSLPGYLQMGWTPVGRARRDVFVAGPAVLAQTAWARIRRGREGNGATWRAPSEDALTPWAAFASALPVSPNGGVRVAKDGAYLRWRYGSHPWFRYRLIGAPGASAVVRMVSRRGVKMAIITESTAGDEREWREVLAAIALRTGSPVLQSLRTSAPASTRIAGWRRFERTGPTLVVRSDRGGLADLRAWSLTTGELEFF